MKTILPDLMAEPKVKTALVNTGQPKFLVRAYIQGRLLCLKDDSIMGQSIRQGATDLNECIRMIKEQARSNRESMAGIIGEELLMQIEKL